MGRGGGVRRVFWRRIDETRNRKQGAAKRNCVRGLEIGRRSFGPRGTAAFIVRAGESMIRKKAEQEWGDFERDAASRFSNAIALH